MQVFCDDTSASCPNICPWSNNFSEPSFPSEFWLKFDGQNSKVTPPPLLWLSEQAHQCIIPASSFDLFTLMPRWLRYNSSQFSKQPNWGYRWVGRIWNHNCARQSKSQKIKPGKGRHSLGSLWGQMGCLFQNQIDLKKLIRRDCSDKLSDKTFKRRH